MKYRARANGNVIELSDEAAAVLVPSIYERIDSAAGDGAAFGNGAEGRRSLLETPAPQQPSQRRLQKPK